MSQFEQAIELRKQIDELDQRKAQLEGQLNELYRKVKPTPKYGNREVFIEEKNGVEYVRLSDYLLNEEEKKECLNAFKYIDGEWREWRSSVNYYRNEEGILVHDGGGWLLLQDSKLCSDEEWESIKQGIIPEKFLNPKL